MGLSLSQKQPVISVGLYPRKCLFLPQKSLSIVVTTIVNKVIFFLLFLICKEIIIVQVATVRFSVSGHHYTIIIWDNTILPSKMICPLSLIW